MVAVATLCPADGSPLPPVADTPLDQIPAVIAAARRAQPAWAAQSLDARAAAMAQLARRMLEKRAEMVDVLVKETGRSETECLLAEVIAAVDYVKAATRAARRALAPEPIKLSALDYPGKSALIEAVPRGVVVIIAPWNYPLANFFKSFFPALLAGNAVVLKPSEHTPRSGKWLAELAASVLPAGLVGLVLGAGPAGQALLDGEIDAVVFTGSVRTGRKVAQKAAERLIPSSIELGGKDAAIVLADADLDRTALGVAQWGVHNAGQNCAGIERVYVEAAVADAFIAKLATVLGRLRVSEGRGDADLGPLQNAAQLEIVERHVEEARAQGAKIWCGGRRTGKGLGYLPTLVETERDDLAIMSEETFGPVLAIARVKDAEEAIRRANASRYGLNGSVWTRDIERGKALARKLEVGVAYVNNHAFAGALAELPWTGVKETGTGVAASHHAYATFVRRRTLFVDKNKNPDPWWMPLDQDARAFAEAIVARSLGSFGAIFTLAGLLGKRVKAAKALLSP
ncbi:MAG: aldehyde dehydrogenase family protein [Deltaproteobacteria bacterium]|nr:aldehyde dehydrogenase family protein [Deltaproteobacteria bacterium]